MRLLSIFQLTKYDSDQLLTTESDIKNLLLLYLLFQYLFMKPIFILAIAACILELGLTVSVAPEPFCLSKPLYKQFPLVMEEVLSHDFAESFAGYNLDIQLTSNNTFATMSKKFRQLDRMNTYIFQMVSHYIEKKDNSVGKDSFILYKDITGSYHFTYGAIKDKTSLPTFNTTMIVTTDKNVRCFDGALFLDYGLAIVDCIRINPNNTGQPFTNIFFYLDLTGHKITKIVQNEVYADFKMVTRRKLAKFTNPQTHYPYLIRAYFAEGVEKEKGNTYIQFFGAQDPYNLQIFDVVDRTFLHEVKLAINDLEVYNGDIYFLDEYLGLYRLDVLKDHKLLITGKLKRPGFSKFSVYSDDLQDEIIVALSNSHNVYEIDWSWEYMFTHEVVNKYSIPSDSQVRDIKINGKYVVVQAKANVTNSNNTNYEVDYTWIFTKGSRTYMNAYQVIQHNSSKVDIDLDPSLNHIYSADQGGLALFKIDQARLNLHYINQSLIGKKEEIVVTAISSDPINKNKTVNCSQKMTVIFTAKQDMTIFATGYETHSQYSANYPGDLFVDLDMRFLGPNITYGAFGFQGQSPSNWVNKINRTFLTINTTVRPQDITFFHTDILNQYGQEILIYYFQDTTNKTHIAQCVHAWEQIKMVCRVSKEYQHDTRIATFTTGFVIDSLNNDWDYYYFMVFQGKRNQVRMIDFVRHKIVTNITYQGHQQAEIHNIASSNGYLYVLRKNVKTIDVYNIMKCKNNLKCTIQFSIDMHVMKSLGVDYFSPQQIITDTAHPEVLFIKCLGSLIVLDVDNKKKLHLMDTISSAATRDPFFRVAVNKYRMIISTQPNIIQQYNLQRIYQQDSMTLTKIYPMYGYKIQPGADIQFSDMQSLVYVNAFDPQVNVSVILVYRSGWPGSTVLYDTIYLDQLYSRPGFEVQVSGGVVDFVSIAAGNDFRVYRVFEHPSMVFDTTVHDFNFTIKAQNTNTTLLTDKLSVSIVNFPSGFEPTKLFNDTLANLKVTKQNNYTWQDRKWFDGHVINYNYTCKDCNSTQGKPAKIKLREHLDNFMRLEIDGNDFIETLTGGIAVHEDLYLFRHNGSIKEIINLPDQKFLQTCLKVAAFQTAQFVVTACQQLGRGINLYMTTLTSFKPITMGPFISDAYHARGLQVVQDVVLVVNQNPYPDLRINPGSVFLYRASVDPKTLEEFELLEEIDNNDFMAALGWDKEEAIIGNAYLTFSSLTNAFRLYVTEIDNGFFVVDFTRHTWQAQIHILSIQYVNMNDLLKNTSLHMPSDATYQGITFTGIQFASDIEMERVIVTTKGYHNFEVILTYDKSDKIQAAHIHRVYYRYGFYHTVNDVKAVPGYVAIGYVLPAAYVIYKELPKQYVAIYDTSDYEHQSEKGYSERYVMAAYPFNFREPVTYAFNMTYDVHTNGSRIGLILSDPSNHLMYSASLSKTLSLEVHKNYTNQTLSVTAYSDYKNFTFNVTVFAKGSDDDDDDHHHDDHSKTDEILFIIVVVVASVIIIVFGGYIFHVVRKRSRVVAEERVSLLTGTQSFMDDTIMRKDQELRESVEPLQVGDFKNLVREDSGYNSGDQKETESNPARGALRLEQQNQQPQNVLPQKNQQASNSQSQVNPYGRSIVKSQIVQEDENKKQQPEANILEVKDEAPKVVQQLAVHKDQGPQVKEQVATENQEPAQNQP